MVYIFFKLKPELKTFLQMNIICIHLNRSFTYTFLTWWWTLFPIKIIKINLIYYFIKNLITAPATILYRDEINRLFMLIFRSSLFFNVLNIYSFIAYILYLNFEKIKIKTQLTWHFTYLLRICTLFIIISFIYEL